MKIRNYQLQAILEQCKNRGLTKINEILEELKEFDSMKIVVEIKSKK